MDDPTKNLIEAAIAFSDSIEWDISDNGHAGYHSSYDAAEALSEAVAEYRKARGLDEPDDAGRQRAIRDLASLVRR